MEVLVEAYLPRNIFGIPGTEELNGIQTIYQAASSDLVFVVGFRRRR
jgi:hypothetical protein